MPTSTLVFLPAFILLLSPVMNLHAETDPTAFRTALVYDEIFLEHDTGTGFPEHADRLRRLTRHLKEHPVSEKLR